MAIKVTDSADMCISTLLQLLETKITYVVQEVVVVIRDIFRKYPNKYETVIPTLCANMDELTEPEPKSAIVWIVGHYADRIDNAVDLLDDLSYNFLEEAVEVSYWLSHPRYVINDAYLRTLKVQLAILTAVVKLFIRKSDATKDLVTKILKLATEEVDNPDLRDRGFMYWRLLSTNAAAAQDIVLSDKPPISTETDRMDRGSLDQLLLHAGTLGSIYHKSPEVRHHTQFPGSEISDSLSLPDVHSNSKGEATPRESGTQPRFTNDSYPFARLNVLPGARITRISPNRRCHNRYGRGRWRWSRR
jgi:AP-2 complex subunit beta-1